jgi:hypothetical protein
VQREAKDGDSGVPARNRMNALAVADTPCNPRCGGASACNMDVVREGSARSRHRRRGSWRRSVPCLRSPRSLLRVMNTSPTLPRLAAANSTRPAGGGVGHAGLDSSLVRPITPGNGSPSRYITRLLIRLTPRAQTIMMWSASPNEACGVVIVGLANKEDKT